MPLNYDLREVAVECIQNWTGSLEIDDSGRHKATRGGVWEGSRIFLSLTRWDPWNSQGNKITCSVEILRFLWIVIRALITS